MKTDIISVNIRLAYGTYYNGPDTRVFECEVEDAIISTEPGADAKSICRRVKLVREIVVTGDRNTGSFHTGVFGIGEAPFFCFGLPTERASFPWQIGEALFNAIKKNGVDFDPTPYLKLPNATPERIKAFAKAYVEANKK